MLPVFTNAFEKHKKLVSDFIKYYGNGKAHNDIFKPDTSKYKTELDIIHEQQLFIWDESEEESNFSWEKRLAKRYYDKLFKEYCICDLTFYKENKIAMRWRIEKEVLDGKGQFICGNKKCIEKDFLKTWEVNFGYIEKNEKKNALVKLRLCSDCSLKLNFHKTCKEVTKHQNQQLSSIEVKDESKTRKKHLKRKIIIDQEDKSDEFDSKKKLIVSKKQEQMKQDKEETISTIKSENKSNEKNVNYANTASSLILDRNDEPVEAMRGDSIWKRQTETEKAYCDSTDKQIEDYLEDLFF